MHTDVGAAFDAPCRSQTTTHVISQNTGAEPVPAGVGDGDGVIQVTGSDDGGDRPEGFTTPHSAAAICPTAQSADMSNRRKRCPPARSSAPVTYSFRHGRRLYPEMLG